MATISVAQEYLRAGKNLTPLNGKEPKFKNWTRKQFSDEKILSFSEEGNLGWVIGDSDLVLDVDPKNGGEESFKKLCTFLSNHNEQLPEPTVTTPSGGFHVYYSIPEPYIGKSFRKTLKKQYPGIDFLTKGTQCVIPSSTTEKGEYVWSDEFLGGFYQTPAPVSLLLLILNNTSASTEEDLGDFEGLVGGKSSNWSEDKVFQMLENLDPSMPNDEWVKVGMALHDWHPVDGLPVWEEWSKAGDNYTEGDTAARWRSFDRGGGVTLGSISYMVKEVTYDQASHATNEFIQRISVADEKMIEFTIAPEIQKQKLSKINLEKLAKAIQDRFKEVSDVRIPIGNVRGMIMGTDLVTGQFIDDQETPAWCEEWVYVNSHAGFMNLTTLAVHKSESFNIETGKFVPMSEGGTKPSASKYVADRGFMKKVDSVAYFPTSEKRVMKIDGLTVLNSFNPRTVPKEAEEYTKEGKLAIAMVKKHIRFICTTHENADILTQWLAHQIQYPGRQILWAPVIQSIQGVGKSFFGEMLRMCLGDRNVGVVSPSQVTSDYNGWSTNVVVNVLEELRVKGHNRYDAVNALKPLITDRMIQINDKNVKQFVTYNTTNYICFTNYKDSLPLEQDDRRWWVIFVPIDELSELGEYMGESVETYFPKLFTVVRRYGGEIRKWFLEYEITPAFMEIKQAPMTADKRSMIATEEASFEGLSEIKDIILKGGPYWNPQCVSSSDMFEMMNFEHPEIDANTSKRNMIMKKLGYSMLPTKVKIDGKARRIWTKKPMENDEVRESFRKYLDVDDL